MNAHRSGPWNTVAVISGMNSPVWDSDGYMICDTINRSDAECEANARLIAAAPELLQALKAALMLLESNDVEPRSISERLAFRMIDSAIEKAEEES